MPACHETTITNVGGTTLARLPLFGKSALADGESFSIEGNPWAWIKGKFPGIKARRMLTELHRLIDAGTLQLTSYPSAPCGSTSPTSSSSAITAESSSAAAAAELSSSAAAAAELSSSAAAAAELSSSSSA